MATDDKQLGNCVDAVARGAADALGDALMQRAAALRGERRRLLLEQERIRQSLAATEAVLLDERRISENLDRFGALLPTLSPNERKELIRLFVERVYVRRIIPRARPRSPESLPTTGLAEPRLMEVRIKLHLAELVRGLEVRSGINRPAINAGLRAASLDGRIDFTHANRGEVAIVAPFRRTVRLDRRVRTVQSVKPKTTFAHPIARAQQWQRMLDEKAVPHRFVLARQVGVTPGAVTKMLKLTQLLPEIQEFLGGLKERRDIWHGRISVS